MMWDTQVECYTQTWYLHSVYALVFGVVYILGIPGMFFSLLYQSRHFDTHRRFLLIKANPTRLVKTLKLAREDYWNKGIHWGKITSAKDEEKRIKWFLSNMNMRSPKTQMRIGFLYRPFQEDLWAFELFEFGFKLMMTGVMVHIRPGTVTQIIAGLTSCFIAFAVHLGFQPYNDNSNNVLMSAGKMQLFLTLMLALLLKMEAAFFTGNAQMDEADLSSLANIIIGSSACLVLLWLFSIFTDCYTAKKTRAREKKEEDAARKRRARFKKTTNLLKAATLKKKIFGGKAGKQLGLMDRKNQAKRKENEREKKQDKRRLNRKKTAMAGFGASDGFGGNKKKKSQNLIANALAKKPDSIVMREIRQDFGAGSEMYVKVVGILTSIKHGELSNSSGQESIDVLLSVSVAPVISEQRRKYYSELIQQIIPPVNVVTEKQQSWAPATPPPTTRIPQTNGLGVPPLSLVGK